MVFLFLTIPFGMIFALNKIAKCNTSDTEKDLKEDIFSYWP